ncbi:MAG: ElyC/SanA/YdcF family protein [Sediminicola sp.]
MKKKLLFLAIGILVVLGIVLGLCNHIISYTARDKIYDDLASIPKNKVGLVLGTAKKLTTGGPNPYYTNRIKATLSLYRAGKIDFVLVSGDNGSQYYNEPGSIKKDLVAGGIPGNRIILDYAGFRTLDSMVRAKYVFGLKSVTVISQQFHNERAIFLAERKGLKAVGYNATDISGSDGLKVRSREYFARVKVFVDLVFNTQPKFYGERIYIE